MVFMVFMVPGQFSWLFMVLGWFFLVPGRFSWFQVGFHGSRSVFMIFDSSRLVFHGLDWFSWFFVVPGWFFMVWIVFHGFSWFQVGFFYGSGCVLMIFHGSMLVFHDSGW